MDRRQLLTGAAVSAVSPHLPGCATGGDLRSDARRQFSRAALPFVGRLLMGGVFLVSARGLLAGFSGAVGMMATKGVPVPAALLGLVIVAWLIGGICLAIGYRVGLVAPALALLLVPVTLGVHAPWLADAASFQSELNHCLANLAFIGGLLCTAVAPAGRFSIDAHRRIAANRR